MNAEITAGAVHGSTSLTVKCVGAVNGTTINAWRGMLWLGSATIVNQQATITVTALAKGDVVQCSVGGRGQETGLPVIVGDGQTPTGWQLPSSVVVVNGPGGSPVTFTRQQYIDTYGHPPLAKYDPALLVPVMAPELTDSRQPTYPAPNIVFDATIDKQEGQTVVKVENVQYQAGGILVRFADTDPWSNQTQKTFTTATTISVDVKGTDDPDSRYVRKTVAVSVFAPPTATPTASDITGLSYEWGSDPGNRTLSVLANSAKDVEVQIVGFDATWRGLNRFDVDRLNRTWGPIPAGSITIQARVAGDTDQSRWRSITTGRTS